MSVASHGHCVGLTICGSCSCRKFGRFLFECCNSMKSGGTDHRRDLIYLIETYTIFWAFQAFLLLVVMLSPVLFVVPFVLSIWQIEADTWDYGFQMLTVLFLSVPLLIYVLTLTLKGVKRGVSITSWDSLYCLKVHTCARSGRGISYDRRFSLITYHFTHLKSKSSDLNQEHHNPVPPCLEWLIHAKYDLTFVRGFRNKITAVVVPKIHCRVDLSWVVGLERL